MAGDEAVDDGTLVVRRRAAASTSADGDLEQTRISGRTGAQAGSDRRPVAADVDADTGSTMIVRRESRRRAEAAARVVVDDVDLTVAGPGPRPAASTVAADVPAPLGRLAQGVPVNGIVYDRRADGPAMATRTAAPQRVAQAYVDTAAEQAIARRRARRQALVVVSLITVVVVGSAVAILLLAFTG